MKTKTDKKRNPRIEVSFNPKEYRAFIKASKSLGLKPTRILKSTVIKITNLINNDR